MTLNHAEKKTRVLPNKKYDVIYADPPWSYKSSGTPAAKRPCLYRGDKPHSVNHYYDTMSLDEIKELNVNKISKDNAVCFLWVTNPMLPDGFEVLRAWGFKYKTCFTWHKERCKGMGYWFRGHTEHILLCVKGNVTAFRSLEHNIKKLPVENHSKKPSWFRFLIENVTGEMTDRIELFARERAVGWDSWGNEVDKDVQHSLRIGDVHG